MTAVQLPAHLQNRNIRSLTERASEGMGSTLPPHISIQGNSFTFIDAAGNEYQPVLTFDAAIVDISDYMNKRYYDKPFDPNASSYEPPVCWSANGLAPSREATKPQAPTCADCQWNQRGSAVSRVSGVAIKACRDERWVALLVPQMPQMIFQLVITPGSFSNWKAHTETFRNYGVELSLGLTRFSFVPKKTGEIMFEHVGWVDEATIGAVEASVREKKTDAIVGRTDQPRALAAPAAQQQITHTTVLPPNQIGQQAGAAVQEVIPPQQSFIPAAPTGAPVAANLQTGTALPFPNAAPVQPATSPSEAAPRRRRTKVEMAAANPAQQTLQPAAVGQQGFVPAAAPQPSFQQAAPQVPFPVAQSAPVAPAASQAQFGLAPGAPVNPEMAAMLAQMGFVRQTA